MGPMHPRRSERSSQAPWAVAYDLNRTRANRSRSSDAGIALSGDDIEEIVPGAAAAKEVIGRPERVERARLAGVQSQPRLPLPAPVQQADRTGVQLPALPHHVVVAEPVLVPPVPHDLHLAGEHQEERREGAQLVNPGLLFLHLHPVFQLHGVPDHYPCVEVAGARVRLAKTAAYSGWRQIAPERQNPVSLLQITSSFLPFDKHSRGGAALAALVRPIRVGVRAAPTRCRPSSFAVISLP
jgi:hypothetical protein